MIDFIIHPSSGSLNTRFAVKPTKIPKDMKYRFIFTDNYLKSEVKTKWTDSDITAYYKFKNSGTHSIIFETKNGEQIKKDIIVDNSFHFGTGKTLFIKLAQHSQKILIVKSIGLFIYDILTKKEIFLKISLSGPNDIYEININRAVIISHTSSKIGLLDLKTGEILFESDEKLIDFDIQRKIFITSNSNETFHIIQFRGLSIVNVVKINGKISFVDLNHNGNGFRKNKLLFSYNEKLYSYYIGGDKKINQKDFIIENITQKGSFNNPPTDLQEIGEFSFDSFLGRIDEYIICSNDKEKVIWSIDRKIVYRTNKQNKIVHIGPTSLEHSFISFSPELNFINKKSSDKKSWFFDSQDNYLPGKLMSYSFEIINNDLQRGYTTSKYPKFALNHPDYIGYKLYDYNFDSLDLTSIDGKGKFISWLANGKYFSVKESEETKEYTIYCTNTLEKIIKTEGNATSFNCKGKWIFYAFNGDDTIFYDIVKGKELYRFKGKYNQENIFKLKKYNQLWITNEYTSNNFIYDGISNTLLREIEIISETKMYYLTKEKIINKESLRSYKTIELLNPDKAYECFHTDDAIGSLQYIITKKDDSYLLISNPLSLKHRKKTKFLDKDKIINSSEIHPSNNIAALSYSGKTEVIDLDSYKPIKILNTNFIKFDSSGNLLCSDEYTGDEKYWGKPRIFDSKTFKEIQSDSLHNYKFISRDEKLGISLKYANKICIEEVNSGTILNEIENVGDHFFNYMNYFSFHPFYNIIAAVGASPSNGLMKLYAYSEPYYGIEANNKKNKKIKVYFSGLHLSSKALWKCGFSNNGKYLATYSSTPVTILFSINQYTKFSKKTPIAIKKEFNNKSFECFSPDNKNIVLSNIRYSAIYSGGLGWENATDLWIYSLKDYKEIKHFSDHNDDICFANYSEDGNKIVSRSRDGLVVLRNLN